MCWVISLVILFPVFAICFIAALLSIFGIISYEFYVKLVSIILIITSLFIIKMSGDDYCSKKNKSFLQTSYDNLYVYRNQIILFLLIVFITYTPFFIEYQYNKERL